MVHFFFLLDTTRCNTLVMYAVKHGEPLVKISAFNVGWDLVMRLIKPFIEIRSTIDLEIGLSSKIYVILRRNVDGSLETEVYEYPRFGETRQRSNICLFPISGQNQKKKTGPRKTLKSRY